MPQDYLVLREIWEGKIPVEFCLASNEIAAVEPPKPFYVLVPRISYFPLVLEKAQKYFSGFVTEEDGDELWLDYQGIPLKWHYPIGVIYDLYKTDEALPWQITLHFKDFPETDLIRCHSKEAVEAHFMQAVKEADQLKHKAEVINSMQKIDHKQLWNGLASDRFDQFWAVNKRLMENNVETPIRHVPFRIYQYDRPFVQKLCKPFKENGDRLTMEELVTEVIPSFDFSKSRLVSHGIEIPRETPMLWLAENLAYPDNFIHLCLCPVLE